MMRAIIRKLLLVVLVSALAGLYFLVNTNAGLRFDLQMAAYLIPGTFSVKRAQGTLLSPLSLQQIIYQDEDVNVAIDSLALTWNPWQLWKSKFAINQLTLNHVCVKVQSNNNTDDTSFDLQSYAFLKWFTLNQITVNQLILANDQHTFVIDNLQLEETSNGGLTLNIKTNNGNFKGILTQHWDAQWNFAVPDISVFFPDVKGNLATQGTISGDKLTPIVKANFNLNRLAFDTDTIQQLTGKLQLNLKSETNSILEVTATNLKAADYHLAKLNAVIAATTKLSAKNFMSEATLELNGQHYVSLLFSMPQKTNFNNFRTQSFTAKGNLTFSDVKKLAEFIPGIKNLQGNIQGALELNGTVSHPTIAADLQLLNGEVTIPVAGITLKNVQFKVHSNNQAELNYSGSLESNQGSAQWQGTTALLKAGFPTEIRLTGSNLQVVKLAEYKIIVSPDLQLHFADDNLHVEGQINIPEAFINPKDFSDTIILPEDVVFVGQKPTTANTLLALMPTIKIHVSLGENIFIHYQDLETKLRGNLELSKTVNSPTTAVGELRAYEGTYRAYNKVLTIQQGRLIYTGGLITNPGLDIKATREIKIVSNNSFSSFTAQTPSTFSGTETLSVGVQILGTLDNPNLSLFSEPALPQPDILSYLILGIPQSETGPNQQTLLRAASAMGVGNNGSKQFEESRKKLQEGLGLSELNVESVPTFNPNATSGSGTSNTTSLVVGKKLAPNLYVHYSIGLFDPVSVVNVRYILSKRWSIQSETSTIDTGADFLYSIERE